ncbi:TPA: hypothetical protein ACFP3Z_000630 [Neisseria subflava]|uniref:hypothetical protein n=1 Tax=Neisseria sp. 27098_8_112 TaxID=3003682 RepID=UPI00352C5B87
MNSLPIVDVFETPYEIWTYRNATLDEGIQHLQEYGRPIFQVRDKLEKSISNAYEAAVHMALIGADNALEDHINKALNSSSNFKIWRQTMPSKTPIQLTNYQRKHTFDNSVVQEINKIDCILSDGQFLFHGGCWMGENSIGTEYITSSPFSTSFCPQVALRNAEWGGKAYDAGVIDLLVLKVTQPDTRVFSYKIKGTDKGNEKEVLFSSDAKLKLISSETIRCDYKVCKVIPNSTRCVEKEVCINVKLVEIS